jgi:EAL domain-containing protein (putative c-di-GMP-specific phosphodiesterase class I)
VKIPIDFTSGLVHDPTARAVVDAIVTVAHALDKRVIAEGVETRTAANELRSLDVEFGQGFLWGRPTPQMVHSQLGVLTA